MHHDRRAFLRNTLLVAGGVLVSPSLRGLLAFSRDPLAGPHGWQPRRAGLGEGGYGPLVRAGDQLDLPEGFRYAMLGIAGSMMSDGRPTPRAHDGMAAFPLPNGNIRLIRNHEMRNPASPGHTAGLARPYDRMAAGGTTSLEVRPDGEREVVRDFRSLSGTMVNCAGGPAPWGSWLTCEETTIGRAAGFDQPHGYVYEVPVSAEEETEAVPLKALGRFVHEAVAIDPRTGIVYETEDTGIEPEDDEPGAGFYRFVPHRPEALAEGGRLQMLAIQGEPRYETYHGQEVGQRLPVHWVDIDDVDPPDAEEHPSLVFYQGYVQGGAIFMELEGCWQADDAIYFHASSGGDAGKGQVWQYRPAGNSASGGRAADSTAGGSRGGELTLLFESPGGEMLDSPDNITVSPRGGIVMCEDGDDVCYVRGLSPDGKVFDLVRNRSSDSEFAGACFSPDGQTLFVNIQGDWEAASEKGRTFAIWGPWERGAL